LASLDKKHLVTIVNNEFLKDPRVHRTIFSLTDTFGQISVVSGVPHPIRKKQEHLKNIVIYRHRFFKPNFGGARIVKWATVVAVGSKATGISPENSKNKPTRICSSLLRNILFLGWFTYLLMMNLVIVIRYRGIAGSLYYANDLDTLLAGYLLSRLHRARLIYDAHELYSDLFETGPKLYRLLLNRLEGSLARKADAVITVNDSIAEILQARHDLPQKPTVLLNCPPLQPGPTRTHFPRLPYKILYHGMYLPGRNLEGLVLSMQYVEDARLYLRGYGVLEELLKQIVDQHRLHDKVFLLDPVPMAELISQAAEFDIGIVPYPGNALNLNSYYCTPNKAFEYMMAGLALAVSDLPELKRIVNECEVGITFDSSDPKSLGQALRELTKESLQQMQVNASTAARETFNFELEAQKLRRVIQNLQDSKGQGA